jgi:hypothetical protein
MGLRSLFLSLALLPALTQAANLDTFEVGGQLSTSSNVRTVLLEAAPPTNGLSVEVFITGLDDTQVYRLGYRLTNSAGDIIPVNIQDLAGNVRSPSASITYTGALQSSSNKLSLTSYLIPGAAIPLDDYSVRVVLEYDYNLSDFSFTGKNMSLGSLNPQSASFEFRLFSKASDSQKNTKLRIDAVTATREVLFQGLTGWDAVPVTVELRALRYDVDSASSTTISPSYSAVLIDSGNNEVAAEVSLDGTTFSPSVGSSVTGIGAYSFGMLTHTTKNVSENIFVRPASPLSTSTQITGVRFSATHNDHSGLSLAWVDAIDVSGTANLIVSDGLLRSGSTSVEISSIASVGTPVISGDTATVAISGLELTLPTGHTYLGNASIGINGDQVTELNSTLVLTAPSTPDTVTINGILMQRGTVALTPTGPEMSGGEVRLPRGLGWVRLDPDFGYASNVLENRLRIVMEPSGTLPLNASLTPAATNVSLVHPSATPASPINIALNEESKPFVWITNSVNWTPGTAIFSWNTSNLMACHDDEWDLLEESASSGGSSLWIQKRDNRAYLRKPDIPAASGSLLPPEAVLVGTGTAGDARIATRIQLNFPSQGSSTFNLYPQAPMGAQLIWDNSGGNADGLIVISNDQLSGQLNSITAINQGYYRNGIDDPCLGASLAILSTQLPADSQSLLVTPDGGLLSPALLFHPTWPTRSLEIGSTIDAAGAAAAVHTVAGWTDNSMDFLMAGISLPGAANWHTGVIDPSLGVSTLLNTGYSLDESDTLITERPGTAAYTAGSASYPGLNFRVASATAAITGFTHLGDARLPDSGSYTLRDNSKYYVRLGGVSGAHDVDFTSHAGPYFVYGYELDFHRFGLAYLNNLNAEYGLDSTVAADLQFSTAPLNGFALAFDKMSVTGGGDLQSGDLLLDPDNPKEPLAYWGGSAIPRSFAFNPKTGAACDKVRLLVLGVETYAALIDSALHGYLAIASTSTPGGAYSNGSLVSLKDAAAFDNTRARIFLPGLVQMRGPATTVGGETTYESYPIRPVADAYFNNYDITGRPDTGFIAFGATMGVAFFEDLQIHVRTPAANGPDANTANIATIHLSGGWTTGSGHSFWNHPEGEDFDADHKGWDGDFTAYWTNNHESNKYNILAEQDMFGLIEISYPVQWDPSLRQFSGAKQSVDLIVLNANHVLDFLTAERASITFGVKAELEGIPNINLGSIAMNATGAANGLLATLSRTASAEVGLILDQGTQAINSLLKDVPEDIFTSVWDSVIAPQFSGFEVPTIPEFSLIDDLIVQLETASAYSTEVENTLKGYLLPSEQKWFFSIASDAMQALDQSQSVIRQIDGKLAEAQNGIRAITAFSVASLSAESVWSDSVEVLQPNGTVLTINWAELSEKAISNE